MKCVLLSYACVIPFDGRGFESLTLPCKVSSVVEQSTYKLGVAGSNPALREKVAHSGRALDMDEVQGWQKSSSRN